MISMLISLIFILQVISLFYPRCFLTTFLVFGEFVDKHFAIPNLSLVNKPDLMKILKAEIFVHTDGQLRTAHLILGYNPLSSSVQLPKCVIKEKDSLLH